MSSPGLMIRCLLGQKSILYVLVGGLNTLAGYGMYAGFVFVGLSVPMASLCSLVLGILISFITQGTLVFKNATPLTFLKFVCAWGLIYCFNLMLIRALQGLGFNAYIAGAIATVPVVIVSFFILNGLVFRKRAGQGAKPQ